MAHSSSRPLVRGILPAASGRLPSPTPAQRTVRELSLPPAEPPSLSLEYPPRVLSPSPTPPPPPLVPLFRPDSDDDPLDIHSDSESDASVVVLGSLPSSAHPPSSPVYVLSDSESDASVVVLDSLPSSAHPPSSPAAPAPPAHRRSPHVRHDERVKLINEAWRADKAKVVGSSVSLIRSAGASTGTRSSVSASSGNVYAEKQKRKAELDELDANKRLRIARSEALRDRELGVAPPRITVRRNRILDSDDEGFALDSDEEGFATD